MKYFTVICSLLITVFFTAGYFIVFLFSHAEAEKEMRSAIRSGKLTGQYETLSFSNNEWKKLKVKEDEFLYREQLFDVVAIKEQGGVVQVTCIADNKESELIAHFASQLSGSFSSNSVPATSNHSLSLLKFLQTVYLLNPIWKATAFLHESITTVNIGFCYESPVHVVINPPPEIKGC